MSLILMATLSMGGLAAFFGRLKIEEDPRVEKVLDALPGVNCGACGFASCHALAEAIVKGKVSVNACMVGGQNSVERISEIMGVESETVEKKVVFVLCGAIASQRSKKAIYQGVSTCRAANLLMGADTACQYGCLGFGDCERVCPFNAIEMVEGLPRIDLSRCTGCGRCVEICPRNIIILESFNELNYRVKCSSLDRGKKARQVCQRACIACGRCVKSCPYQAIWMEDNLAHIDPRNCQLCGVCFLVCPTHAIVEIKMFNVQGSTLKIRK